MSIQLKEEALLERIFFEIFVVKERITYSKGGYFKWTKNHILGRRINCTVTL